DGLPDDRVGTLFEDSAGRVLASTLSGMAVFDQARFVPLRSVSSRVVYAIVEERVGDLWISEHNQGLLHVVGDEVVKRVPWSALGHDDHANSLTLDPARNGLWAGFYKGGVAFVKDGAV